MFIQFLMVYELLRASNAPGIFIYIFGCIFAIYNGQILTVYLWHFLVNNAQVYDLRSNVGLPARVYMHIMP